MEELLNENQVQAEESPRSLVKMIVIFLVILIVFSVAYFFRGAIIPYFEDVLGFVDNEHQEITIAYAEGITSFDPANYEARNRNFLGNIYDPLVRFDKNLNLEPALAVSWGRIDDLTWEFKLRDLVIFHDGSYFDSEDVVASIENAISGEGSQLKSLLSTIDEVEATSDLTVRISTKNEDPILPNRLAQVLIFSSDVSDFDDDLIGTGPYYATSYDTYNVGSISEKLSLNAFSYYWGYYPDYDEVSLVVIPDKNSRKEAFLNGEAEVIVALSADSVEGLSVVTQPSLEVNFMLFNTSGLFEEKELREAFAMSIDKRGLSDLLNGYVRVADQFVPSGVSGYDSSIDGVAYDPASAALIFEEYDIEKFSIDMAEGATFLGEYIVSELERVGVKATVNYWDVSRYQEEIYNYSFDVYSMGWKCDVGDAADLYETVFVSNGAYNGGYKNEEVDELVSRAASESEGGKRILILKEIMGILAEEDIAGVPLFESEIIYGVADGVGFSPRVDGYIWAADLS